MVPLKWVKSMPSESSSGRRLRWISAKPLIRFGHLSEQVGAAFSSSANSGGGSETTIIGILEAMLIAGMVVQGDPQGAHYGPLSIGRPDDKVKQQCTRRGQRVAELTKRLFP